MHAHVMITHFKKYVFYKLLLLTLSIAFLVFYKPEIQDAFADSLPHNITFSTLKKGGALPDGDVIRVDVAQDYTSDSEIAISLQLKGVTWWKGIQSGSIVLCQAQDSQSSTVTTIKYKDLKRGGVQLWKAKTFGIHRQMYDITDAISQMKPGNLYTFVWSRD
jgi:hypothetical protein